MKILDKYNILEIKKLLENSKSFRDFLSKIKSSSNGSGSYKSIKNQIKKMGIEIPVFNYKDIFYSRRTTNDEIFKENSTYSRHHLKKKIIKENLIEYVCEKCKNNGLWLGEKLSLNLEHKNGINNDNRLENLSFLCPNCHSQTDTYSGKNLNGKKRSVKKRCSCGKEICNESKMCLICSHEHQRKIKWPNFDQLLDDVKELGYTKTGKKYGVSDNSIRKWIKYYKNEKLFK